MRLRRVEVLGGGPGGLYVARLLALARPGCEVVVHEQGERGTTFGFGVGLAAGTQRKLEAADADTLRDIRAAGRRHDMTMDVGGAVARVHNDNLIGIARTELLEVLGRHAEKAGVRLEYGERRAVADVDAADLDADVVIAADGVGSATREAGDFGAGVEPGRGLFLWCGAAFALDDAVFAPVDTEFGTFVTHAYPYAEDRSTFLVETDEATWRAAGLDGAASDGGTSDTASLAYLSEVFAGHLRGHPLIGNGTRWQRFRTVTCERWSDGRVVLLGDAAHTAHYSIGSGTKLAMEDAIALVEALGAEPDRAAAFARYEAARRPSVERLQELARRSRLWWESFGSRTHLPVERLMVSYMTRAGNVPLDRFAATSPDVVGAALGQYAGVDPQVPDDLTGWVLDRSRRDAPPDALVVDAVVDDPWGPEADAAVAAARDTGAGAFRVVGPPERPAVLTRLDLAERLRTEVGGVVTVVGPPELRDDLAAGLVSGRADVVGFSS
ncbi:FAD-dependent monooxygenase [Pseudonocardia sp.]|uniref:FAD-dependent monooxygenase n=1 Tax=Pseudonocardia sp. TaxID=60912 RepID=UPI002619AFE1|nr:FAD-dependent monooxygenase [Pseudonocardia sp.]